MSGHFSLKGKRRFEIKNYQDKPTFASFLPGIAGKLGIPLWAFYVNRGQGIASFGIESKDHPIMEFYPANKSYRNVETRGFRTFIKEKRGEENRVYEPFRKITDDVFTRMIIAPHTFTVEEKNPNLGLRIRVRYFILPNESFGALVRRVSVKNISDREKRLEVLDGMPILVPYGVSNEELKMISQTISAWLKVYAFENGTPFYRLKASSEDKPSVEKFDEGMFYLPFATDEEGNELLQPIVDPEVIFENRTSLEEPVGFVGNELADYAGEQVLDNRFPSAMSAKIKVLSNGEELEINSVYGHLKDQSRIDKVREKVLEEGFLDKKEKENADLHSFYADHALTVSSEPRLDAYSRQIFIDNSLRGGFPFALGDEGETPYHLFSRKHGDLERDYNEFYLEPTYYSQGNGNFRDVNQNRRCDLFFNPTIKEHNVRVFNDLIRPDGYNPLVIKGDRFCLEDEELREEVAEQVTSDDRKKILERLEDPFTPGELAVFVENREIDLKNSIAEFVNLAVDRAERWTEAEFGEGYWIDHWTYNLDLIENYLAVYPENLKKLLVDDEEYTFYDSHVKVQPRDNKYVLTESGPRQLNAITEVEEKKDLISERKKMPNRVRTDNGEGEVYYTTLLDKLLTLLFNKISSLDPSSIGIEMEAGRPGWYDALNGLPGMFGSSTSETMELMRLVEFLQESLEKLEAEGVKSLDVPIELYRFYENLDRALTDWIEKRDNFEYWDRATSLREKYREKVFMGFDGEEEEFHLEEIRKFLDRAKKKLSHAIELAEEENGLFTTYLSHKPVKFEETGDKSDNGRSFVEIKEFEQYRLPVFLEGQVRAMKIMDSKEEASGLHKEVRNSQLYDEPLGMYRVNGDLSSEPNEIGRARAFSPGWLENGSIWMHMEYKYLLELLKSGLYDRFYQEIEEALVPFQDPATYGRSILENSSFIMSSLNDDSENHGRGYIARLSGSTAEYLHMWSLMAFGSQPFAIEGEELIYSPSPALTGDLFTEEVKEIQLHFSETNSKKIEIPENCFAHRFLGSTLVIYHNPKRGDTFDQNGVKITGYKLVTKDGEKIEVDGEKVYPPYSEKIRDGKVNRVDVFLE